MKFEIIIPPADNPYHRSSTWFEPLMQKLDIIDLDLHFIIIEGEYRGWTEKDIIFDNLSILQINQIQNYSNTFLVFDFAAEGYNTELFFKILYHNCKIYNISPTNIIYITSNLQSERNIVTFNNRFGYTKSIKVFSCPFWILLAKHFFEINISYHDRSIEQILQIVKENTKKQFIDKHFFSLSRRSRPHRVSMQYLLSTSNDLSANIIISQNKFDSNYIIKMMIKFLKISKADIIKWKSTLPIIADISDFEINPLDVINEQLYCCTIFELVQETMYGEPGLFYSEKTFRPMLLLQPFIIFGQQGCNRALADLGFKLYTDWFDYSFDDERNNIKRLYKIIAELKRINIMLASMSTDEKIDWKYQNIEVLFHNFNHLFRYEFMIQQKLVDFIESI